MREGGKKLNLRGLFCHDRSTSSAHTARAAAFEGVISHGLPSKLCLEKLLEDNPCKISQTKSTSMFGKYVWKSNVQFTGYMRLSIPD